MALVTQELPLVCLMLFLLCRETGVTAQVSKGFFSLQQPQANVSVTAGETLTLRCTISGIAGPGPVKWLKGRGRRSKIIYDQRGYSSPRVTRAVDVSDTDFTIHIRNVQPEDMGTYYCVKFVKGDTGEDEVFQRGSGTEVSMQGVGAQMGPRFSLQQPQANVSVTAGETLTLRCTISGIAGPGPVTWLKGWGSGSKIIYDQRGSLPRVTRAVDGSDTDFTIHIRNVQPEDMGTYYCVKFVKGDTGEDEMFQRGSGTEVSVQAKPSPPFVSGPGQRAEPEQTVPFTCTSGGFFPKEISVKWFKNKDAMVAQPSQVTEWEMKTFNVSSTVRVTLQKDDVRSQLICEVQHSTLPAPLRGSYQLSRVLRVPPSVEVRAEPSPVEVDKTVTFSCLLKEFYPANVSISWLENGIEMKGGNVSRPSELPRGLFQLRSQVEVQATEERNGSTITCMVVHDAQAPANYSASLLTSSPAQGANLLSSLLLLCLGILLEKGLLGGLLFLLFKRMKKEAS